MRRKLIFLIAAAVLVWTPLWAQEQTGALEGAVKDAEGAVLPGVTVEATSPAIGTVVATTDAAGRYRFPRLPSGVYAVKASLEGYKPAEAKGINLTLGQILTVNLALEVGSFEETIVVNGEGAQIDVTQSATATSISREQLQLIPKGRDFTTVATQAPGVTSQPFLGGLSVDGASGSENRFVIDGTDTTEPMSGISGQRLITDFVEEVQVKSAGYQAEYGGSVGGVISAVTKSGTNEFAGSLGLYYGDRSWDGSERATPQRTSSTDLYTTFREDSIKRTEPFFNLGGPIVRDKAWFFLGYSNSESDLDRTPIGQPTVNQNEKTDYYLLNLKGNVGSKFLYKLAGSSAERKIDNTLPARNGTTPLSTDLDIDSDFPTESYSAYADFVPTASFYFSARAGFYSTDQSVLGSHPDANIFFRTAPFPIASDPRYRPAGFFSGGPDTFFTTQDLFERKTASLDGNLFFSGLGSHALKGGVQSEEVTNDVGSGELFNLYTVRWGLPDRFGAGVQGTYGSLGVRRFRTEGGAASKNLGFYLQDGWAIRPNFTVNLGVRTEKEEVPNYAHANHPELLKNAWEFDYGDKLAPRVGFAWDVKSDQKLKIYGSWGRYFDISKLNIRGSFGGDRWIEYLYPLETLDWATLPNGCHLSTNDPGDNPCPALGTPEQVLDLRFPADPADPLFGVDPDLKPFEQEEAQLGADYQLTQNSVVGVRYVDKSVKHAIEDMGFFYCFAPGNCVEGYNIGNPGEGVGGQDPEGPVPAQPKAKRDYTAVELNWSRRFADNWSARVAYTYSELTGNYPGLASSDEFGRTAPNTNRLFDYVHNSFDRNGNAVYGKLNTDRPHQVTAQALYRFDWGTTVGVNQYYGSGTPISTQVFYAGVPFFAFGRGDAGDSPSLTQTDLLITHPVKIGSYTIEASLNVLNLFDEKADILLDPSISDADICSLYTAAHPDDPCDRTQEFFFSHTPWDVDGLLAQAPSSRNPYYLKPNATGSTADPFQTRRTIRLGLKFSF
jgi:hypothetical protein